MGNKGGRMSKLNKIDDSTRIELACNIAHHILIEYLIDWGVNRKYQLNNCANVITIGDIIRKVPREKGRCDGDEYTDLGQDLFNSIYDNIEKIVLKHFEENA